MGYLTQAPSVYADLTVRQGRAAYYFDQLGSGTSDKPPSSALTLATVASVLHQVIRTMRTSPRRGGHGFSEVNVVGHSLGSYTAIYTAARYRGDIDRLVVTGALHVPEAVENAQHMLRQQLESAIRQVDASATQSVVSKSEDTTFAAPTTNGEVAKTSPAQNPVGAPQMKVPASQTARADRTIAATR